MLRRLFPFFLNKARMGARAGHISEHIPPMPMASGPIAQEAERFNRENLRGLEAGFGLPGIISAPDGKHPGALFRLPKKTNVPVHALARFLSGASFAFFGAKAHPALARMTFSQRHALGKLFPELQALACSLAKTDNPFVWAERLDLWREKAGDARAKILVTLPLSLPFLLVLGEESACGPDANFIQLAAAKSLVSCPPAGKEAFGRIAFLLAHDAGFSMRKPFCLLEPEKIQASLLGVLMDARIRQSSIFMVFCELLARRAITGPALLLLTRAPKELSRPELSLLCSCAMEAGEGARQVLAKALALGVFAPAHPAKAPEDPAAGKKPAQLPKL